MSGGSSTRGLFPLLVGLMGYGGYVLNLEGGVAPFLAADFGLADADIARTYGWIAFGAFGTLLLSRLVDRFGRRAILLASLAGTGLGSLASAAAPTLAIYVAAQLVAHAFRGALFTAVVVMIAEQLPKERRATGQSWGGLAEALGTGGVFVLVAACAHLPGTWRWTWLVAALPLVLLPLAARSIPETARFEDASERGETARARVGDLLKPPYRRRTLGVIGSFAMLQISVIATQTWLYYYPVASLGVAPEIGSAILIAGGLPGLLGFWVGGRLADGWGRRGTFVAGAILYAFAALAYYGFAAALPLPLPVALAAAYAAMLIALNAANVAFRALVTELFPTRLRGTLGGCTQFAGALGVLGAMFGASALASRLGGLAPAVSLFAFASVPAALVLLSTVSESKGLELEAAALETAVAPGGREPGLRASRSRG